jgi:hypothetical protein
MSTKNIHISKVLSFSTERLMCDMGGIYEVAGQIAGDSVFTHQLIDPYFKEELFRQHPSLKDAPAWEGPKKSDYTSDQVYRQAVTEYIASYLKKAEAQFGSELPIKQGNR